MSFVPKFLISSRLRSAKKRLSADPSAANYLAVAAEHAKAGAMQEALEVCEEGCAAFPGEHELRRMADRLRAVQLEDRTRDLAREIKEAPRPALYRELCEILLATGRVARAEECAGEWFEKTKDPAALTSRARARLERFFSDRRREDGMTAWDFISQAMAAQPGDERPLRLALDLFSRTGAWADAFHVLGSLLQVRPGDPLLEARYRTLAGLAQRAPQFDAALRQVERSGELVEHKNVEASPASATAVRPALKEMGSEPGTRAALFTRGSTALVQGVRGATAERTARALREIVQNTRTTARRLGLGVPQEIELEGDFGFLTIAPGERGCVALWTEGRLDDARRLRLGALLGPRGARSRDASEWDADDLDTEVESEEIL